MLVYAGIDEAGYGPMFGPLCVASTAFILENCNPEDGAPDMWKMLHHIICKKRKEAKHKIAINDSKQLKSNAKTKALTHLERGIFVFMDAMGLAFPDEDGQFFDAMQCKRTNMPWYESSTSLPVGNDKNILKIDSARLKRVLIEKQITCVHMECSSVDVGVYNERTKHATKSALNFSIAMHHVNRILKKFPTEHPRIMIDRHGGRTRYRDDLLLFWPESKVQVLIEDASMSRYRLDIGGKHATVTFASKTDEEHLPAALASMIAKYTRELYMLRFNRYFGGQIQELKPTAGYVQDGRRFLQEIEPIMAKNGLKHELLVRSS
jgi:ribonuclease HII